MIAANELNHDIEQAKRASLYLQDERSQTVLRQYVAQLESLLVSAIPRCGRGPRA